MSRRTFLAASAGGVAGGAFAHNGSVVQAGSAGTGGGKAKSTILIWLSGGQSHIDLWDMNPEAPREIRGDFQPVATSAPDVAPCEHLPQLARQAHHLALVRSLGQGGRGPNDHHPGIYYNLTGHPPGPNFPNSRQPLPDDWPFVGSVVAYKRPPDPSLPAQIWLPTKSGEEGLRRPGAFAARLGVEYGRCMCRDNVRGRSTSRLRN